MGFLDNIRGVLGGAGKPQGGGQVRFAPDIVGPDGRPVVIEGPFPLATPEGRLICKNCGTQFDWGTVRYIQATYASETDPSRVCMQLCRKCSERSVFSREDVANVPALPGMTSKPRTESRIGSQGQLNLITDGPLPVFDPEGQLLCRGCGLGFTEATFEHWRKTRQLQKILEETGTLMVHCTNCKAVCAFRGDDDLRLLDFISKLVESLPVVSDLLKLIWVRSPRHGE